MESIIVIFSVSTIISVIMCILSLNLIHSVFWLTASFISSSFILLNANIFSIALVLLIIYVGAIAIMFIFSVMMVDLINLETTVVSLKLAPFILIVSLIVYFNSNSFVGLVEETSLFNVKFDFITLGDIFFNFYNFAILGSALILLIPMIGALVFLKMIICLLFLMTLIRLLKATLSKFKNSSIISMTCFQEVCLSCFKFCVHYMLAALKRLGGYLYKLAISSFMLTAAPLNLISDKDISHPIDHVINLLHGYFHGKYNDI